MKFNKFINNNFRYILHCDYDYYYACEHGSDCYDNDYCRCGIIQNIRVSNTVLSSYSMADKAVPKKYQNSLEYYCLERFISCVLRAKPEFNVGVHNGYYGQEISDITMEHSAVNKINTFMEQINNSKTKAHKRALVETILEKEYGYILPDLSKKNWTYERVPIKNIVPANDNYRPIQSEAVDLYTRLDTLSCLCRKDDNKYLLVDGYHRYVAALKDKRASMKVLWCPK